MDEVKIGIKVKTYREDAGMSLRELAAKANLSPSMLSQIENDASNPSINTLKNLAVALNVPLYKFFQESTPTENLIVRRGEHKTIGRPGEEVQYELLTQDVSGQIEFELMKIPVGKASAGMPRGHIGEEVAYVIKGNVDILLEDSIFHLEEGDAVRIPPNMQHRWTNPYGEETTIIFAVSPPSF